MAFSQVHRQNKVLVAIRWDMEIRIVAVWVGQAVVQAVMISDWS